MDSLQNTAQHLLEQARAAGNGRAAQLVVHDGPLRQTVMALAAGTELPEHNSPPAASMQVLTGRVAVTAQNADELAAGHIAPLTHHRHSVTALEDSVFLLTTVTGVPGTSSHDDSGTDTGQQAEVDNHTSS
ncbi:cupin [Kocuria sp.]|uniref:cupin n=1 Tax=Kocuria sp. TaxID=1871328 RepID=UPI0026DF8064|nr:cupin [Kocuria sp.]MDO5619173.1 cupin [Kocuria sp.]